MNNIIPITNSRALGLSQRVILSCLLLAIWPPSWSTTFADETSYEDANKVLTKYCAGCHNPDDANGDFEMDTFAGLIKGGETGNAMTPGSSKSSRMVQMMLGKLEPAMPPEGETQPTDDEIQIVVDWIDSGAKGPDGKSTAPSKLDAPQIESNVDYQPVTVIAFSPDEKSYAVARFGKIEIRDTQSDQIVMAAEDLKDQLPGKVTSLVFADQGETLLAGTGVAGLYGEAVLIDLKTKQIKRRFRGHRDMVYCVTTSQDEKWLVTSGYDRKSVLWSLDSDKPVREFLGHNDAVFESVFDSSGELLITASADATAKVWDVASGERLDTRGESLKELYTAAISPDGKSFVAAGEDNRIRKWQLESREPNQTNPLLVSRFAHESAIELVRFHADGKHLVSVGGDGRIKIWGTELLDQRHVFEVQTESIQALAVGKDLLIVGRMDGTIEKMKWPAEKLKSAAQQATQLPTKTTVASNNKKIDKAKAKKTSETEPNDDADSAMSLDAPFEVTGVIHADDRTDVDVYRFYSDAGQSWSIQTRAARDKSPLDTQISVLDSEGAPVPRVLLRAVRDSYFTFRGKNSKQTSDFRIHNWEEMQLNQLLYCNGEVVRLFHYPRGPDSGFNVYPNFGDRHGLFDTTSITHALQSPCYIVEALPPGSEVPQTGLPSFLLNYENDDDATRRNGKDSRVNFVAPESGEYLVRVRDSRDFSGEDHKYTLSVLPLEPSFSIRNLGGANPTLIRGGHKKMSLEIHRDEFNGPINVEVTDLPEGISVSGPVSIEPNTLRAFFTLHVTPQAPVPDTEKEFGTVTAVATVNGEEVRLSKKIGKIKIEEKPKLKVHLKHAAKTMQQFSRENLPVFEIRPGETITARVAVTRVEHKDRINFGKESAALNLPFGVYVDNTGLNGVLITPAENERTFFLTAEDWVEPSERLIFLESAEAGKPSSNPGILRVLAKKPGQ